MHFSAISAKAFAVCRKPHRPHSPDLGRLDPGGALRQAIAPARSDRRGHQLVQRGGRAGVIVNDTPRRSMLTVGEANDADSRRIADLRAALAAAEIQISAVAEIRLAIWRKLVINMTASILCLLTGHKATVVRDDERIGALFGRAIGEAIAVARAHADRAERHDRGKLPPRSAGPSPLDPPGLRARPPARAREPAADAGGVRARGRAGYAPVLDAIAALAVRMDADQGLRPQVR